MVIGTAPVQAISFGPAARYLAGNSGRVLAVLSEAVYIESEGGHLLGIVGRDAPDGPFSLRVDLLPELAAGLHGKEGCVFTATQHEIRFAGGRTISLLHAREWTPSLPGEPGTVDQRVSANDTLCRLILMKASPESFGPLAGHISAIYRGRRLPEMQGRALSRAASALNAFLDALTVDDRERGAASLIKLLGLGLGLTPSGDDLLAGLLACLTWHARHQAFDATTVEVLSAAVLSAAPERTNRISLHLLRYACKGLLYETAMTLGSRLLGGKHHDVVNHASRLLEMGSSSGADMAVGIALGCAIAIAAWPKMHPPEYANRVSPARSSLTRKP